VFDRTVFIFSINIEKYILSNLKIIRKEKELFIKEEKEKEIIYKLI
jgi:hypothetical protein